MILVSTAKPHPQDAEYAANQKVAFLSWLPVASKIVYFGEMEPDLNSDKTRFVPSEPFPKLKPVAEFAAKQPGEELIVILNADIVLTHCAGLLSQAMREQRVSAATSKRLTICPGDLKRSKVTDSGLDIFAARPMVWKQAAAVMPEWLRFGHIQWDTWLIGFFNLTLRRNVANFTDWRCVFHPAHSRKAHPYQGIERPPDRYIHAAQIPGRALK